MSKRKSFYITIPGEPVAWDRAGVSTLGKKPIFFDRNAKDKSAIKAIVSNQVYTCVSCLATSSNGDRQILKQPLKVDICFFCKPPATLSKGSKNLLSWGLLYKCSRPDVDNYFKLISDALNNVLYLDDAQIIFGSQKKKFDSNPRTVVKVQIMDIENETPDIFQEIDMKETKRLCDLVNVLCKYLDEHSQLVQNGEEESLEILRTIAFTLSRIGHDCESLLKFLIKKKDSWKHFGGSFDMELIRDLKK